jgi:hypothetical protein
MANRENSHSRFLIYHDCSIEEDETDHREMINCRKLPEGVALLAPSWWIGSISRKKTKNHSPRLSFHNSFQFIEHRLRKNCARDDHVIDHVTKHVTHWTRRSSRINQSIRWDRLLVQGRPWFCCRGESWEGWDNGNWVNWAGTRGSVFVIYQWFATNAGRYACFQHDKGRCVFEIINDGYFQQLFWNEPCFLNHSTLVELNLLWVKVPFQNGINGWWELHVCSLIINQITVMTKLLRYLNQILLMVPWSGRLFQTLVEYLFII